MKDVAVMLEMMNELAGIMRVHIANTAFFNHPEIALSSQARLEALSTRIEKMRGSHEGEAQNR